MLASSAQAGRGGHVMGPRLLPFSRGSCFHFRRTLLPHKHPHAMRRLHYVHAHAPTQTILPRGSSQVRPQGSPTGVQAHKGELDMALYSVLQQSFWGDENAAVKRLAAEAAMLAKLCCGDTAAVSTGDLNNIFRAAGVQAGKFGTALSKDSAVFCRQGNDVQLQPAFQQHLLARMAESQSQPIAAPPPPSKHMIAMQMWKAKLEGARLKTGGTKDKGPRISAQPKPVQAPLIAQFNQDLDKALRSVLQHCFVGFVYKAEIKRLTAAAVMMAEQYGTTLGTSDLHTLYRNAGLPSEKFGRALSRDPAFAVLGQGSSQVILQPDFHKHLHERIVEFQSSPLPLWSPPRPPRVQAAMESLKAMLEAKSSKRKQTNSSARPDSFWSQSPTALSLSSPTSPQVSQQQDSTHSSYTPPGTLSQLKEASGASQPLTSGSSTGSPPICWCDSSDTPLHKYMLDHVNSCTSIAIDCEWSHDRLCIIQIHAPRVPLPPSISPSPGDSSFSSYAASTYLLDVQGAPELLNSLEGMLSNPSTLKVFHDCRQDVARLHEACKVRIAPVLDTQVAHALLHHAHLGSSLTLEGPGSVPRVGLKALLDQYGIQHRFKEDVVEKLKADPDRRLWQTRPLPTELMVYAANDVEHLLTIAERMGAQTNHLVRQLSQYQADTQQGSPHGKPPPLVELQMRMGPGFSPSYYPYAKDAQPQIQAGMSSSSSSSYPSSSALASASQDDIAEAGLDEEAASVIELLPTRLRKEIRHMLQGQQSAFDLSANNNKVGSTLTEVHIDEGRPVKLRFMDRSAVLLPIKVPVAEAVSHLVRVKEQIQCSTIQGGVQQDPDSVENWDSHLNGHVPDDLASNLVEGSSNGYSGPNRMSSRQLFGRDGRMALPGMLHRVSGMRDSVGNVYALTYRVGRHQPGLADIFSDLLARMCARRGMQLAGMHSDSDHEMQGRGKGPPIHSILIMGPPGCGKTTLLRDMARLLSTELQKEVNVIDTSSEIAGDSIVPHPCIGIARRFFVPDRRQQHQILLESVQNHGPEVVIVDEIGTEQEVAAVSTISQRGVKMIGTAHGHNLQSLMQNPVLVKLAGGIQSVVIGDEAAKRHRGDKVSLERRGPPVFSTLIEVLSQDTWRIHTNVAESVDLALAQSRTLPNTQVRRWSDSTCLVKFETSQAAQQAFGKMAARSWHVTVSENESMSP